VVERGGCPSDSRCVTVVTLLRSGDVAGRLGLGILADVGAVVAGRALAGQARMVHGYRAETDLAGVAGIALAVIGNVSGRFARRGNAVVATGALARRSGIVRVAGWLPGDRRVAGIALSTRDYVRCRLCQCAIGADRNIGAVVAGRALPRQACMVHARRPEGDVVEVTGVARRGTRRNVGAGHGESGAASLVAVGAGVVADHDRWRIERVVGRECRPGRRRGVATTAVALGTRTDMADRLGLRVFAQVTAVVASRTLAGQAGMVHRADGEGCRTGMANVALAVVGDVRGCFAGSLDAVVAHGTAAFDRRVVHKDGRLPCGNGVAQVALG